MSEIFSKILKDKNGKVLNVGSKYQQPEWGSEVAEVEILPQTSLGADQLTSMGWRITTPIVQSLELGKEYDVIYNGKKYTCVSKESAILDGSPQVALGNLSQVNGNDTSEPFLFVEFLEKPSGVSAVLLPLDGSTSVTLSIKAVEEVIHKLDSKYVEGSGSTSKYQQPEWGAEEPVTILPENTYELAEGQGYISQEFSLEVGQVYVVNYNGTEYECDAQDMAGMGVAIGNVDAATGAGNTGEPFVIVRAFETAENIYGMLMDMTGAASATMSVFVKVVHKIPVAYLETASTFCVRFSGGDTVDKKFMEIFLAIASGRFVYLAYTKDNNTIIFYPSDYSVGGYVTFRELTGSRVVTIGSDDTVSTVGFN